MGRVIRASEFDRSVGAVSVGRRTHRAFTNGSMTTTYDASGKVISRE